jgi:subtilisin family serine protease
MPNHADPQVRKMVEQILEEGEGPRRSVIVQMGGPSAHARRLLETATEAIQKRTLALTARDVLPASVEAVGAPGKPGPRQKKELRAAGLSMASQAALVGMTGISKEDLIAEESQTLEPLLQSAFVRDAVERAGQGARPTPLWSSASAGLELTKQDLNDLPGKVPGIVAIFPNRRIHVPPLVESGEVPRAVTDELASSWGVRKIGTLSTWAAYGARGQGVKIGLLDTGVDADHPDLKGKVEDWAEFNAQGAPVAGSVPHDSDQHGTHCAGTLVGGNQSGRWIGVAPEATLAAALVLDGDKGGTDLQILAGMQWAIDHGVHVISMSLGGVLFGPEVPDTYTRTIINANRLGIPVVIAVGNEGSQMTGSPGNDFFAFTVGATDYRDWAAGFSGGRTQVIRQSRFIDRKYLPLIYSKPEVSAPGVSVFSATPGGKYAVFNGTSMATPHVAGAIALLLSATGVGTLVQPEKRAYLLQDLIIGSVEELGESGQNHRFGFGRIDVLRAIGFALQKGYARP